MSQVRTKLSKFYLIQSSIGWALYLNDELPLDKTLIAEVGSLISSLRFKDTR